MGGDRVRGKVTIITGASGGIGREVARIFARSGARLVLAARNVAVLEELKQELEREGADVLVVPTDVTSEAEVNNLMERARTAFHGLDIVICSAGVYVRRAVRDLPLETIRHTLDVNYFGTVHVIRAVLPHFLAQRSGHIVAISSVDGKKGLPPDAAYAASKHAVTGFMDVLRQELHGTGVFASTIFPERVDTSMIRTLKLSPVSRRVPPAQVARAVLRAVRQRRREMFVGFLGPKTLIVVSALWPGLGDWLVRVLHLEGVERSEGTPHAE